MSKIDWTKEIVPHTVGSITEARYIGELKGTIYKFVIAYTVRDSEFLIQVDEFGRIPGCEDRPMLQPFVTNKPHVPVVEHLYANRYKIHARHEYGGIYGTKEEATRSGRKHGGVISLVRETWTDGVLTAIELIKEDDTK